MSSNTLMLALTPIRFIPSHSQNNIIAGGELTRSGTNMEQITTGSIRLSSICSLVHLSQPIEVCHIHIRLAHYQPISSRCVIYIAAYCTTSLTHRDVSHRFSSTASLAQPIKISRMDSRLLLY